MVKLSKRTRLELLIVAALAVGSCDQSYSSISGRIEVADVNARNALAKCNGLEDRVSEIESRLNM